jgi:hypothetical protein
MSDIFDQNTTNKTSLLKFLKRLAFFILFGSSFLLFFLLFFIIKDPYHILNRHDDYSYPDYPINMDFIVTQTFLDKNPTLHYNSFILGSSRALMGLKPSSWKKYLAPNDQPIGLFAFQETIYGIHQKLVFLDKNNQQIKNIIILLCPDFTFRTVDHLTGFVFRKHPAISGKYLMFYKSYFDAFISPNYLTRNILFTITKKKSFLKSIVIIDSIRIDKYTNEFTNETKETQIKQNVKKYFDENPFGKVGTVSIYSPSNLISADMNQKLIEIRNILEKHHSNFKIIISPIYGNAKLSLEDEKILKSIFGNRLFDFSGANKYTLNNYNYYDGSHFRTFIGDSILKEVYK